MMYMSGTSEITVKVALEDGTLWATVEEYPGVFATGTTTHELVESLREGILFALAPAAGPPPEVHVGAITGGRFAGRAELATG